MKILHVIGSMNPASGGPCQGLRNTIPKMMLLGSSNEVMCFNDFEELESVQDTFIVHTLGKGISPWNFNKKLIPWLKDNILRFDIVLIHGLWLYHGFAVRKIVNSIGKNKPKVFIMPHGMLDPYFQKAPDRKLKALRNWFFWKLIEKNIVNGADGILFTCETELLLARETFKPYHPKKEINVGYGVEEPPAYSSSMKQAFYEKCPEVGDNAYLLFISRIHKKKGINLLIKAYEKLITNFMLEIDQSNVQYIGDSELSTADLKIHVFPKLVIAGPGIDSTYGIYIMRLINDSELLKKNVYFPGMLSGESKWGAFYGCEAFVLPSHQENFGIAVVEALACSKPVLISNKVNIYKEIEEGCAGISSNDTLNGTLDLLKNWVNLTYTEKLKMSHNARLTYKKYFSNEATALNLYKTLVEK